jgi:hypothetical protein
LLFTSNDYRDTIVTNVTISRFQRTDLLVGMRRITVTPPPDTLKVPESVIYPNPSSSDFYILLPEQMRGQVNIRIFDMSGRVIADYNAVAEGNVPLKIDMRHRAQGTYTLIVKHKATGKEQRGRMVVIRK